METHLMLGNEAVARGAWEAGVQVAAAYPGTPSTEIVTNLARYDGVYAEWSTNEKVAYEVAFGAAMGGARALTAMKSAGASVAADPLISSVYTGVNGGLVVFLAGDPGMASGMTEQDDRYFGRISSMPMLEPADSQECHDFTRLAFELSETYDVPGDGAPVDPDGAPEVDGARRRAGRGGAQAPAAGTPRSTACCRASRGRCTAACWSASSAALREYALSGRARSTRVGAPGDRAQRRRASASSPPAPPTSAPRRPCPTPASSSSA